VVQLAQDPPGFLLVVREKETPLGKKSDLLAALEARQPSGAVPIWELEFHAWDQLGLGHVILGQEFLQSSPREQEQTLYANAEILLTAAQALHFAAITVPGAYWEIAPGVPAYYWLPGEARFRQIAALQRVGVDDLVLIAGSGGVMAMPGAEQYVEFAYRLVDAPEEIEEMARDRLAHGLETARRLRDVGIEAMFTASDIADNRGPYFNPRQMERLILPYLRQWAHEIRAMGSYAILHTDGNITTILQAIASTGIHALQAIDPVAGMDIRATQRAVQGRLCLCGNLDCGLLLTGTPEEVYEAARDLLRDCKSGGGLVLGASNAVQPEVPIENYRAMIHAWKDHGQYGP
jgi:uroporphyrinogen decarboxylase